LQQWFFAFLGKVWNFPKFGFLPDFCPVQNKAHIFNSNCFKLFNKKYLVAQIIARMVIGLLKGLSAFKLFVAKR
jgi:hypothetical protein